MKKTNEIVRASFSWKPVNALDDVVVVTNVGDKVVIITTGRSGYVYQNVGEYLGFKEKHVVKRNWNYEINNYESTTVVERRAVVKCTYHLHNGNIFEKIVMLKLNRMFPIK